MKLWMDLETKSLKNTDPNKTKAITSMNEQKKPQDYSTIALIFFAYY